MLSYNLIIDGKMDKKSTKKYSCICFKLVHNWYLKNIDGSRSGVPYSESSQRLDLALIPHLSSYLRYS